MISYLLKFVFCSGILLLTYALLLQGEKLHRFNRFFLLASLAFALVVPSMTIEFATDILPDATEAVVSMEKLPSTQELVTEYESDTETFPNPFTTAYCLITLVLFLRFSSNLHAIWRRKFKGIKIDYQSCKLILLPENDLVSYQNLLLHCVGQERQHYLTSSFNYSITKKRFIMMTTNTSKHMAMAKKLALIPLMVVLGFLFIDRVQAQQPTSPATQTKKTAASPGEGVSQKHFDEYQAIAKSLATFRTGKDGTKYPMYNWGTDVQRKKLDVIYRHMSDAQKAAALKPHYIPFRVPVPTKKSPTQEQLTSWLDSKKYGVWLNEKRIGNAELKKYKPSDFDYFSISKLERNAINYGKHYFQINLLTPKEFAEFRDGYVRLESIPE